MRKSTKNSRHTKKWYNNEAVTYIHYTLQICHLHTTVSWVDIHSFKAKLLALASKYNIVLNHYCTEKKDSLKYDITLINIAAKYIKNYQVLCIKLQW